jgi:MFS family permease
MNSFKNNQIQLKRFEFLNNLDTGVMKILIPFMLIKMGINMGVFGLALSFTPLMNIVFRYLSSYLSDRFGRKFMSVIGQIIGAIALLGYCFISNVYHYIILEAIRAFAGILFTPSYKAWIKESCDDEERVGLLMKLSRNRVIGTAVGGGLVILLGYIIRTFNISIWGVTIKNQHLFAIFFIFEFLAVIFLVLMQDSIQQNKKEIQKINLKESAANWGVFRFMIYNSAVLSMAGAIAIPFVIPYFTQKTGLALDIVGAFFAVSSVSAVLLSQNIVKKLKYKRPFQILGFLLFMEALTSFFLPINKGMILFAVIWLLYSIFQTCIEVLNSGQEQRIIKANTAQMLQFTGIASSIGTIIGSNLGGLIWYRFGPEWTFSVAGILIFAIGLSEIYYDFKVKHTEFGLPVKIKKVQEA